ncbi:hypothetical protein DFH07DRAFT_869390 [Mycena maculata]|uniref:CxC1-like cysteine cluster associated with KDZ transposases domain-containing protein n=1 Tax=Mycena maculata TaxID=230809 RepID=A0AAD7N6W0_9AGAR|nr:hypothetical protein DFH07DRAFT_869390 [Mycena maculata]
MTREQRLAQDRLRDMADSDEDYGGGGGGGYEEDVLRGRAPAYLSHAGEDFTREDLARSDESLYERLMESHRASFGRHYDPRTRRNRTQKRVDAFSKQIETMADAYVSWSAATAEGGLGSSYELSADAVVQETREVLVVDVFSAYHDNLALIAGDRYVSSGCVRQGWMPVAPWFPTVVITLRALEVYRVTNLRCPRLGIQPFVRALCDLHGVAPRPWLASQFSVAFDVYLAVRAVIDKRVQVALGRDTPNWRLKNACPACLYKLEGEPHLYIPFMYTMDGNNSLSRHEIREKEQVHEDGTTVPGASKELGDDRVVPGDYYLPREEVNKWAKEGLEELMKGFVPGVENDNDQDGCAERWQNMKEDVTARAWGMYDETGIFPALCRHGFVLVVVDMVKSGELAKYGFSVTAHLFRVLGEVAGAYDIGCKFGKMVNSHPLLSKLALDNNFKSLVGAFHGHGHGRRCQLKNLTTYVKGVGLESLEGCEAYFSKSNGLAANTRHASRFHRQQAITAYMKHTDAFDTYQSLSLVMCSKYRRALEIKATYGALREAMRDLGVESREVFETWLESEKTYLRTLSREPLEETMEMEYYQKLGARHGRLRSKATRRLETQRRHALELHAKALAVVHDLEVRMGIETRWSPGEDKWDGAAARVEKRRYRRAIDHLEGLVVSRMFELAKCHMSGTGYRLRKHIAKALQARSKAIKGAIAKYNQAAEAMEPPRPTLDWEQVVECAFLADFDLLRDAREDIRQEPWALPAGRAAMDQHFKLLRADEEIERLNVEIHRFVTYMRDEDNFLIRQEDRLREEGDEGMVHQVRLVRMERGRFTSLHMSRFVRLSKAGGFTGDLVPGVSVSRERHAPASEAEYEQDEDAASDDDEEVARLTAGFINIVRLSSDISAEAEDTQDS